MGVRRGELRILTTGPFIYTEVTDGSPEHSLFTPGFDPCVNLCNVIGKSGSPHLSDEMWIVEKKDLHFTIRGLI